MCSEKKLEDEVHGISELVSLISTKVALRKLITSLEYYHVRTKTPLTLL